MLFAPILWDDLRVGYRAFLHLAEPLTEGVEYTLTATSLNATWNGKAVALPVKFDAAALSENIRLNQIGFLPQQAPKRAWVGQYAGQDASGANTPVRFFTNSRDFDVIDGISGRVAY